MLLNLAEEVKRLPWARESILSFAKQSARVRPEGGRAGEGDVELAPVLTGRI